MKCAKFGCDNEVNGWPCCSQEHGIAYKMERDQIKDCFNSQDKYGIRELYTVEMAEYYAK